MNFKIVIVLVLISLCLSGCGGFQLVEDSVATAESDTTISDEVVEAVSNLVATRVEPDCMLNQPLLGKGKIVSIDGAYNGYNSDFSQCGGASMSILDNADVVTKFIGCEVIAIEYVIIVHDSSGQSIAMAQVYGCTQGVDDVPEWIEVYEN